MTKPKKWHLEEERGEVSLHYPAGPIRKPNAVDSLGAVVSVSLPKRERRGSYSEEEALLVSSIIC